MTPSSVTRRILVLVPVAALLAAAGGCKDDDSARRGDGGPTELKAQPYPLPPGPGPGKTTLTWRIGHGGTAQLYVSVDGRPEKKVAEGHKGSKEIDWIHPGRDYQFKLYQGEKRERVLATLAVRKNEAPGAGAKPASAQRPAGATGVTAPAAPTGAGASAGAGATPTR